MVCFFRLYQFLITRHKLKTIVLMLQRKAQTNSQMKNYIITGSIGHISKPLVLGLVKAGKNVSVITSSNERAPEIESLGAKALVGNVANAKFVESAFKNADVIYTMIPPIWQTSNWKESQLEIAHNYADAIRKNAVKFVVNLSSIGADVGNGIGPVDALHDFEKMLNEIPGLAVKHLRPSFFYYNLLAQIGLIKQAGIMGANYGEDKLYLVHPKDIAAVALEELVNLNFSGNSIRYIAGDERSGKEVAAVLGNAIGKELQWVVFTDEQQKQGMLQAGLSETHAQGYTQMGIALREGLMQADARKHKPALASIKLEDFAKEFASAFNG
jgi:nucleoside-diphosphate-sugar epimerase